MLQTYKKINFKSLDGLQITADYYEVKNPKNIILLCHRSHCNRAEYRETAPKLNRLGYSCLAIDQRSGMKVFGETNETSALAKKNGLETGYLDARPDIEAAIDYCYLINEKKKILLLGSSYSAALALLIATKNIKIKSLLLFSPGEHLKGIKLKNEIKDLSIPIFATSAKKEIKETRDLLKLISKKYVTQFEPKEEGFHGSKMLWESVVGYEFYWKAVENFIN